mgnify:CR=1 FL=1
MKKLKYEKPEVEIELLDPEFDIIRTSGDIESGEGLGRILEEEIFNGEN